MEKERTTICFDADVFDMLLATALSDEGKTMDEIRKERK